VYRKPTHTDRYLHAESPEQKQSAINSLVHKTFTISDKEHLQTELNHLKTVLQKNGHDKKDIIKTINKQITVSDTIRENPIHSPICQRNNRSNWQDIKQTQYPNYL